jgi:hypothetical protein
MAVEIDVSTNKLENISFTLQVKFMRGKGSWNIVL